MAARPRPLAVGVDVGGTWIRIAARTGGHRAARTAARVTAIADLETYLSTVWKQRGWSGRDVAAMVVASKGIWTRAECDRTARRLASYERI